MLTAPADVLVIDDSEIARRSMAVALERAGYSVVQLETPIGATRVIFRHEVRLVVVDVNLPAIRGDKLAALFRGSDRLKDLRVLLVSGLTSGELEELGRTAMADQVLPKSAGPDALVEAVKRLIGNPEVP